MKECKNCKNRFTFLEIQKSLFLGYKKIICKKCNTEYFFDESSYFLIILVASILFFLKPYFKSLSIYLLFSSAIFVVTVPFLIKYRD